MRLALIVILSMLALPAAASAAQEATTGDPEPRSNKPVNTDPAAVVAPIGGCVLGAREPFKLSGYLRVRAQTHAQCWGGYSNLPVRARSCYDYFTSYNTWAGTNCNPNPTGWVYTGANELYVNADGPCYPGVYYYRTRSWGQMRLSSGVWAAIGNGYVAATKQIAC